MYVFQLQQDEHVIGKAFHDRPVERAALSNKSGRVSAPLCLAVDCKWIDWCFHPFCRGRMNGPQNRAMCIWLFFFCIQISLVVLSVAEACLPQWSPLSLSGFGGSLTASPSALLPAATYGIREHCGLGSVQEYLLGSLGVLSYRDIHQCGKSRGDANGSAVGSGHFLVEIEWSADGCAAGGWDQHRAWHPTCSSTLFTTKECAF